MTAYYNEIEPYPAQWLRNLIAAGLIAPGEVDERSIVDVSADDVRGFTQCHFFAGIGIWSHALRKAGWPDDRPVWTGSCPCQPFSAAGKGEGAADPRHLWPEWFRLIGEHRPVAIFGEQVGAAIRHGWLDLVSADLEGLDYTLGAAVVGAHSVGAPHIRQRLFFVGHALGAARKRDAGEVLATQARLDSTRIAVDGNLPVGPGDAGSSLGVALGDTNDAGPQGRRVQSGERAGELAARSAGSVDGVGDSTGVGQLGRGECDGSIKPGEWHASAERPAIRQQVEERCSDGGFWSACDWLDCIDGKARPVEPGTFPLAHGATARVGRLRAYGNAIVAPQAAEFIKAAMSLMP